MNVSVSVGWLSVDHCVDGPKDVGGRGFANT